MNKNPELSVLLTVHNKGWLVGAVVDAIMKYTKTPFELVVVYDGCVDDSENAVASVLKNRDKRNGRNACVALKEIKAADIHETRSNNLALKSCVGEYAIIVQDDMIVNEDCWDERLMTPLKKWNDVFAVSARNAFNLQPGLANIVDLIGRTEDDTPRGSNDTNDRNIFRIRQCINRGPLCLDMNKVKQLNYLDETFAPCDGDDADLCLRASHNNWKCGVLQIDYLSDLRWGTSRVKANSEEYCINKSLTIQRNWAIIDARHRKNYKMLYEERKIDN